MNAIKAIFQMLFKHKWKFALMLFSALIFTFLLFPFKDLSDLVTAQVSKLTGNQIYLQFEDLHISVLPQPGVALDQVYVEGTQFPALKSQELILTPSLSSLISQKPGGSISAKGFMRGELKASLGSGTKSENGTERQKITLKAENISLAELKNFLSLPVSLKGSLQVESEAMVDLTFKEQPDADLLVKVDRFELPTSNVQTMMGPLTLPEIKLTSLQLKGRLAAGKFIIEEGVIGRPGDELSGTIKGNLGLEIRNLGASFIPVMGGYSLDIDLKVKKSFEEKSSLFLSFIDQYKTAQPDGARYAFKLSAVNPMMPPSFGALR